MSYTFWIGLYFGRWVNFSKKQIVLKKRDSSVINVKVTPLKEFVTLME